MGGEEGGVEGLEVFKTGGVLGGGGRVRGWSVGGRREDRVLVLPLLHCYLCSRKTWRRGWGLGRSFVRMRVLRVLRWTRGLTLGPRHGRSIAQKSAGVRRGI